MEILITLTVVVIIATLALSSFRKPIRKKTAHLHIPNHHIIYTDSRQKKNKSGVISSKLLRSEEHGLTGKPDYIYKHNIFDKYVPVELKSAEIGSLSKPYPGDLMQLVAYFELICTEFGKKPRYGRLIYDDYMFIIKNTRSLRKKLYSILSDMRSMLDNASGIPCEPSYVKCRYCMCRGTVCEYQ